ncbi:hypothetical protein AAMO2058_001326700 [Amorphochlora amoebiformis]
MLFCYTFFRQKKDNSIRRGYLQKSLVVVSPFPFADLFQKLVLVLGKTYFSVGESSIEAACQNIAQWPRPKAGLQVSLPFLGDVLPFRVPTLPRADNLFFRVLGAGRSGGRRGSTRSRPMIPNQVLNDPKSLMGWFVHINLYKSLYPILHHSWHLWELVLTGKPILVTADSPQLVSEVVLALVSLISPLTFKGDYRPYFSIFDDSMAHFQSLHDARPDVLPSLILGVTNPFLLKTFQNFPNVICIGKDSTLDAKTILRSPTNCAMPKRSKVHQSLKSSNIDMVQPNVGESIVVSRHTPTFLADSNTISRLLTPTKARDGKFEPQIQINGMVLRKHFHQLTQLFLMPFETYFEFETEKNVHLGREWNPYLALPSLPAFREDDFLRSVRIHVDQFPMKGLKMQRKGRLSELYRQFLLSPHFLPWFSNQRDIAKTRMRNYMRARLCVLKGDAFLKLVCHLSLRNARIVRIRAMRYLHTVQNRPVIDKELTNAVEDQIRTLDSLLPPPREAPKAPSSNGNRRRSPVRRLPANSVLRVELVDGKK